MNDGQRRLLHLLSARAVSLVMAQAYSNLCLYGRTPDPRSMPPEYYEAMERALVADIVAQWRASRRD